LSVDITDFAVEPGAIDGLTVVTVKTVTDERGTIREVFRRSAFAAAGFDISPFQQINITTSRRGAVRGMHAEAMTKLLTIAAGTATGVYVDLRASSPTAGHAQRVELQPGVQVLVPAGVANGFQATSDECHYVYCFDAEWQPDMVGWASSPLDPTLVGLWPLPIDPGDRMQISAKDAAAPSAADVLEGGTR